jgi:hypothetical protein
MSETAARSKGNVHGELVTCTFDVTQSVLDGTFHFLRNGHRLLHAGVLAVTYQM